MAVLVNNQTQVFLSVAAQPGNFGATVFNALFAHYGINAVYIPRKAPPPACFVRSLRTLGVAGCSVSMPLKSTVVRLLDCLSEDARSLNSVNTIVQNRGVLTGHNTDWQGCFEVLRTRTIGSLLVFGTGSVVNSVVHAARALGVGRISLTGRSPRRVHSKARELGVAVWKGGEGGPAAHMDLIVNATPSGDDPGDAIRAILPHCGGLFDLRVRAVASPLGQEAHKHGLWTLPGVEMAKFQLQKQMELYTGILPPAELLDRLIQSGFLAGASTPARAGG
jgi:shikimate dehydrogenase